MMLFALVTVIRFLYLYTRTKKLFASFINGLKFIIRKKINNKKYDPSYPLALMHIVYTYIYLGKKLFFYSILEFVLKCTLLGGYIKIKIEIVMPKEFQ